MAVSHVKSDTIADFTGTITGFNSQGSTTTIAATDLVRPADWNSAHNQFFTLSGNTNNASTASGTNVVLQGVGAVTLIGSTGTIGISVANPSITVSSLEPVPLIGVSTNSVAAGNATSGPVSVWPFVINQNVSAGIMNMAFSCSFVTCGNSSGRQTMGINVGLYSRGAGANSTRLDSFVSTAMTIQVTGNNSSYTINQPTSTDYTGYATGATNSGGSNITSGYTGLKMIGIPINSLLTPGQYWLAMQATNSTSSINVGVSLSYFGAVAATQVTAFGPIGSFSSAYTAGSDPRGGRWRDGHGQWSSGGSVTQLPASMNFTSITASNLSAQPHMRFWRT
jgi:hypothetical protein